MGTEAAFVGPLLEAELAAGFAAEMAAGGIFATAAAGAGEFVGPLTAGELGSGFQSYMADLGIAGADLAAGFSPEIMSQADVAGITPDQYLSELESFGGDINTSAGLDLSPALDPAISDYGTVNEFGTTGIDPNPMAQENVFNPTQSMDSAPQVGMDGLDAGSYGYGPAETMSSPGNKLKDILKSPQYQLAKTGIDLYSMASDNQANQAALNRFNQLADRGAWANNAAQDLYTNPNAFFNSPAFKQSQAGAMDTYRRQQAARGRRSDTAGLALQMQKYGTDQFNQYSQGLSRFNTQPNTSGLQGLYQGAGKGRSNMFNTLVNKDLWEAVG